MCMFIHTTSGTFSKLKLWPDVFTSFTLSSGSVSVLIGGGLVCVPSSPRTTHHVLLVLIAPSRGRNSTSQHCSRRPCTGHEQVMYMSCIDYVQAMYRPCTGHVQAFYRPCTVLIAFSTGCHSTSKNYSRGPCPGHE